MMYKTINNMLIELYVNPAQNRDWRERKAAARRDKTKKLRGDWEDYGRPRVMPLDKFAFFGTVGNVFTSD